MRWQTFHAKVFHYQILYSYKHGFFLLSYVSQKRVVRSEFLAWRICVFSNKITKMFPIWEWKAISVYMVTSDLLPRNLTACKWRHWYLSMDVSVLIWSAGPLDLSISHDKYRSIYNYTEYYLLESKTRQWRITLNVRDANGTLKKAK